MKIPKAVFFNRYSTNNIALPITTAKSLYFFCKKSLKGLFFNLKEKDIRNNKLFWSNVKPLSSSKKESSLKFYWLGEQIISEDEKHANTLNKFFSSAVKNQKIEEFSETDPSAKNINYAFFKPII